MNNTTNETSEIKNTGFLSRMSQIIKKYKLASTLAIWLGVWAWAWMVADSLKNKNNSVMWNIPELLPTNKVERVIGSSLIGWKDDKTIEATQELILPWSTFNKSNIWAFMKAFPIWTSIQFITPNSDKRNYWFIKDWSLWADWEKWWATIEFLKTDWTRVTMQTWWWEENLKALKKFNFHDFNREFPFTFVWKWLNATQIAKKLWLNITYKDWPKIAWTIVSINWDIITNEYNIPANTHYVVAKNKLEAKFISEFLKTKIGASEPIVIKYPKEAEKKITEKPKVKEIRPSQVESQKPQIIEKVIKTQETQKTHQEQKKNKNVVTFKINPEAQDIRNALNNNSDFKQKFIKLFYPKARNMDKVAGHYSEWEKRMEHLDKVSIASKLKQDIEQFLKDAWLHKVTWEQLFKSVCRAESGWMLTEEIIQKYLETGNFGYVKSVLHNNFTVNKQCKWSWQMQEGYIKDWARSFSEETWVNMKVSTANSTKIKETFWLLKKWVDPQVVLEKIKQIDSRFDTQKIINIILAKFKEISTSMQEKWINAKDSLYLATMAYSHGENFAEKVWNNFANHLKSNPKANLRNYLVAKWFSASSLDIVDRKIAHLEMYSKANTEAEKRIIENQKVENSNTHIKETDLQTWESKVIKVDFQNKTRSENFSITNEANADELPINQKVSSILDKIQSNPSVQNIQELPKLSAADDYEINKTEYTKFVEKYKLTHNFTKEDIANLDSNKTKTIAAFESFVSSSKYDLSKETKILSDKFMEYYLLSQFGNDQNTKVEASENARNIITFWKVALTKKLEEKKIEEKKIEAEKEFMKISLKILPPVMHNLFELDVKNYLAKNPGHTHIQAVEYILEDNRAEIATYTWEKAPILLRDRNKQLKHLLHELKKYWVDNAEKSRKHYISLVKERKVA